MVVAVCRGNEQSEACSRRPWHSLARQASLPEMARDETAKKTTDRRIDVQNFMMFGWGGVFLLRGRERRIAEREEKGREDKAS